MHSSRLATFSLGMIAAFGLLAAAAPADAAIFKKPSLIKDLETTSIPANSTSVDLEEIAATGANLGTYTVPKKNVLVITDFWVFPQSPGAGEISLELIQNGSVRKFWIVTNTEPTQLHFSSGLVIAPGSTLSVKNFSSSAGSIQVNIYGYEKPNK